MLTDRLFESDQEERPTKDVGDLDNWLPEAHHVRRDPYWRRSGRSGTSGRVGEVKAGTINYRTFKPERTGCSAPDSGRRRTTSRVRQVQGMKFAGVICDKGGGHPGSACAASGWGIELAPPVSHVWFFKGLPTHRPLLDTALGPRDPLLRRHVVSIRAEPRSEGIWSPSTSTEARRGYLADRIKVGMGAEAIRGLLRDLDRRDAGAACASRCVRRPPPERKKVVKRLKVADAFLKSQNKAEWMILEAISVIRLELRPLVPLDGALRDLDLNLYSRDQRNNRLSGSWAARPEIIIRNEKRMLQRRWTRQSTTGAGAGDHGPNNRPKSLSDTLRQAGRFCRPARQARRYSAAGHRGGAIKLHQCGPPKKMALSRLPSVLRKLEERASPRRSRPPEDGGEGWPESGTSSRTSSRSTLRS